MHIPARLLPSEAQYSSVIVYIEDGCAASCTQPPVRAVRL